MGKTIQFVADTIDGEIQPSPGVFNFPCDKVIPIGVNVVRSFDESLDIVAMRVFEVNYNNHSFGSTQFKSLSDFQQYRQTACACCPAKCIILVNGCSLQLNGCDFVLATSPSPACFLTVNGCNLTFNGCAIHLN